MGGDRREGGGLQGCCLCIIEESMNQDDGKGGLGLRGVAFMTVFAVLTVSAVLESTLPSFKMSYKIQCQETTVTVLAVFLWLWRFRS